MVVVAHQGGWDEVLLVLAPLALFAVLLFVANKRAGRLADDADDAGDRGDRADDDGTQP